MESAIKLAGRFIAGLSRHSSATADVTKPARPAAGASPARPPQRSTLNDSEPRPPTCDRLSALSDIPGLSAPAPSPPPDRTQKVAGNLLNRKEARPRTVKTLTAFIKAQLNNQATDVAVGEVLAQLKQGGMLTLPDGKVTYPPATI